MLTYTVYSGNCSVSLLGRGLSLCLQEKDERQKFTMWYDITKKREREK